MAELTVAGRLDAAPGQLRRRFGALAAAWAAESERRVLWLPVFFGIGIALYFALTVEPPLWLGRVALAAAVAMTAAVWRRAPWRDATIALAFIAGGLAAIQQARLNDGTPMLQRRLGPVAVTGRVGDIDAAERGWRIIVSPDPLPGLAPHEQPRRLRIHVTANSDILQPGDGVSLKAMLYPVPEQVIPGGRDMQRELYFAGIGGVGYSYGAAHRTDGFADHDGGWRAWLLRLRTEMTTRISAALPGSTGGVASAVITGKRGTIADDVKQAFRDCGLSHLLAIAGLHLGLVGGFVFFTMRGGLALIPWVALRYPIKKIAATNYLTLSDI
jgi:competence protein ComEC